MGNLRSVQKALQHVAPEAEVEITADPARVRSADRVVFPGQGAMPDCMRSLKQSGLGDAVGESARGKPFLGLCIGQQMLFDHSAEGDTPGLGLVAGRVKGFARTPGLKIPHMGWNEVRQVAPHALWKGIGDGARFYFVHSFYCEPAERAIAAGETDYPDALPRPSRGITFSRRNSTPRRAASRASRSLATSPTGIPRDSRPPC